MVGLIAGDADVGVVADATMEAAQRGLEIADGDEGLKQTFWLLSQITLERAIGASEIQLSERVPAEEFFRNLKDQADEERKFESN